MSIDCRNIQFRTAAIGSVDELTQLQRLFNQTAFWAQDRSIDELRVAIANSYPIVTAWDGNTIIGFARATSDGVYRATIWDVVIHPDYQGAGLGRKLVQTLLAHPHMNRVERVYLMTTNEQKFYQRIGFDDNQTTTMVLFNQPVSEALPVLATSPSDVVISDSIRE